MKVASIRPQPPVALPKRRDSHCLRPTTRFHSNRQRAIPKRRLRSPFAYLLGRFWLLGICFMRFHGFVSGPKRHQSTSIGGVLSANGVWVRDATLELERWGEEWMRVVRPQRGGEGHADG